MNKNKKKVYQRVNSLTTISSPYFQEVCNGESMTATEGDSVKDNKRILKLIISQVLPITKWCYEFYNQRCICLAKALLEKTYYREICLGQLVVHKVEGQRVSGFIVETECYLGKDDAASHSYKGKRTPRTEPMFMKSGTSYVYTIYGMYYCLNISAKEDGACVLIRALEPFEGIDLMSVTRQAKKKVEKRLKTHQLCNGPSKLCQALSVTKEKCNKLDMSISEDFWLEKGNSVPEEKIVVSKRIGIESAGPEWANKPLRFYVINNACVSVRNKKAEELCNLNDVG